MKYTSVLLCIMSYQLLLAEQKDMIQDLQTPTVVFIHGTLFPFITKLIHKVECPRGIHLARTLKNQNALKYLSTWLHEAAEREFPFDSFYFYGWPGTLSFKDRLEAAEELYNFLRTCKTPVTIIGHSHGCNVALYLAKIAEKYPEISLVIDKLILLACPVQEVTASYIHAPLFKQIYHFYSADDFAQVCDPQGLYVDAYKHITGSIPFFSQRTFKPAPHLVQVQVLFNKQSPGHNDFILKEEFLKKLPTLVSLVHKEASRRNVLDKGAHFVLDIAPYNELSLIEKPLAKA